MDKGRVEIKVSVSSWRRKRADAEGVGWITLQLVPLGLSPDPPSDWRVRVKVKDVPTEPMALRYFLRSVYGRRVVDGHKLSWIGYEGDS